MSTLIELNPGVEYLKTNLKYGSKSKSTNNLDITPNDPSLKREKKIMKVKFDSSIFLNDLFKRALRLSQTQSKSKKLPNNDNNLKFSIGIDIVCYGAYNAKMAYVLTKENDAFHSIEMFENHVGNLKVISKYNQKDIQFIEEFQFMIYKSFHIFGKRWNELTEQEIQLPKSCLFKIIERDQYPHVWFDETRCYSINQILCKFFLTMFNCLGIDLSNEFDLNEKFSKLCVTLPSDFHSYQRLTLKNCFEQIGLKNRFLLVNKSTSLALPFMAKNLKDMSKKLIIDFGSGYMNCSILKLGKNKQVDVIDQLADRSISSKLFFEECYRTLKHLARNKSISLNKNQSRFDLYKTMNDETNKKRDTVKEKWNIPTHGHSFEINMKRLGVEQLANSVIDKFEKTNLLNKNNSKIVDEISDILVCSDAILYEYLEPLLQHHCYKDANIIFMDNDCASLGAAFLASSTLKLKTCDMLPYPIGVGLYNGVVKNIIDSKTNFPCSGKHLLQTLIDNQQTIRVNLYEGESPLARNCKHICEFYIDSLRKAPAGLVKIEIQIEFDQNGVLNAFAKDIDQKQSLNIQINVNSLNYFESKRLKSENKHRVNIDEKLDEKGIQNDQNIARTLQDLDYYFEYLTSIYKNSTPLTKELISKKIVLAKKYISKNRLKIVDEDLDQLKSELDDLINEHRPVNAHAKRILDYKEDYFKNNSTRSSYCTLL